MNVTSKHHESLLLLNKSSVSGLDTKRSSLVILFISVNTIKISVHGRYLDTNLSLISRKYAYISIKNYTKASPSHTQNKSTACFDTLPIEHIYFNTCIDIVNSWGISAPWNLVLFNYLNNFVWPERYPCPQVSYIFSMA